MTLGKMEKRAKSFENNMLLIMAITSALAIAIMLLLPDRNDLSVGEKIREILVVVLVWAMAFIANTVNLIAIVLNKSK